MSSFGTHPRYPSFKIAYACDPARGPAEAKSVAALPLSNADMTCQPPASKSREGWGKSGRGCLHVELYHISKCDRERDLLGGTERINSQLVF